jgi:hypothetical protein
LPFGAIPTAIVVARRRHTIFLLLGLAGGCEPCFLLLSFLLRIGLDSLSAAEDGRSGLD